MTRMKASGFDWRCPCGWRVGWVRTIDELTTEKQHHHRAHAAQINRIVGHWDGLHLATCPYECDCPPEERRPA